MNLLNNSQYVIAVDNFKYKLKFDSSSTYRDSAFDSNGHVVPGEFNISLTFKIIKSDRPTDCLLCHKKNIYLLKLCSCSNPQCCQIKPSYF